MATNLPQMGGGGAPPRRLQQQQLSQVVYSNIVTQQVPTAGWQSSVSPQVRVGHAMQIITGSFLAMPHAEGNQAVSSGLMYERDAFMTSPDKGTYEERVGARVIELFKKRQANEQTIQSSLNPQVQNQAQTMMNRGMQMGGMGQPLQQGYQSFQQPMQSSPINQQAQPNIGINNANELSRNPSQQAIHMGNQMRSQISMTSLAPQDRVKVHQLALMKLNSLAEPNRSQYRAQVQAKMPPQLLAQLQQDGIDPLLYFFQNQVLQNAIKAQTGVNQTGVQMQSHQARPFNQPPQQLQTGPNGEYGPFTNMENIMNQQKAGMLAQEAGQMVVPASSGAGHNAAAQPIGSRPGPNQGPGQPTLPHQVPQQFSHPPTQQLQMDQKAAQSQAQIRAQAHSKQMQGQPGGLNGPAGTSQSPAMNTLNAPVRRTPIMNIDGRPQTGQVNGPFGQQVLDPRFAQTGQRTPMGSNVGMNKAMLAAIVTQMPIDVRQRILSLPADKVPEMIMKWHARANGQVAGRPQPQMGQLGPNNPAAQPMGQFTQGPNNFGQHPGLSTPMNQQMIQHHMNNLQNANGPQGHINPNVFMDNMPVPPRVLEQLHWQGGEPKKWGQLKQWMAQKSVSQQTMQGLLNLQAAQFQTYLKADPGLRTTGIQPPQPNLPQQGIRLDGLANPQMAQPTPNMAGPNFNVTISAQEVQSARNHEKFKGYSDERIRQVLTQMKTQHLRTNMLKQRDANQPGQPSQVPQAAQPNQAPTAPASSQPANGATAPQRQQNQSSEPNAAVPTVSGRNNNKQPQNNRTTPNMAAAPTAKTGTKRPMPDDVTEVPNASTTPVQRPHPQQAQRGVSSAPPHIPQLTPEQLANMIPEQRQKYEAMMVKSRQPVGQMSDDMLRLKAIGQQQHQITAKEQMPDIPMSPEQYHDTAQRIQTMSTEINKMRRVLVAWYSVTHDDMRAKLFFKLRTRLMKQFADGDKMSILRDKFSITATDLDSIKGMLESMTKDVLTKLPGMRKNPSQQNPQETAPPQGASAQGASARTGTSTAQPAPLNEANLEKQTQALKRIHQRNESRVGQPPAAPTTAQPPFPFGAQSPDGQPTYAGKPTVTQDNLQLPARKKHKPEPKPGTGPGQNGPSINASPQVPKLSSPEMTKRQTAAPAKPQILCMEDYCEFRTVGFPTEDALRKHMDEEHIKPAEDPIKFVKEGLAEVLGLDAHGKPKKRPATGSNNLSQKDSPKHVQTQVGKSELADARDTPMKRQGSTAGSKPNDLIKAIAGRSGTPKPNSEPKTVDGAALVTTTNSGTSLQVAGGESMSATIDPQDLLSGVTGLEMGGDGAILDINTYRALTPNDTPESIKDSASSEPNSDVSEGVALSVSLDMGFGAWDPFAPSNEPTFFDPGNMGDLPGMPPYSGFSWDDVQLDFDKPFVPDTSLFSFDTA